MSKSPIHPFAHTGKAELPSTAQLQSVSNEQRKHYLGESIMLLPVGTVNLLSLGELEDSINALVKAGKA